MVTFTFPGFTKKSLTFSIDDGNLETDRQWLDIMRPAGIKGTFNLCKDYTEADRDMLVSFYEGYEIANHVKHHPFAFDDNLTYTVMEGSGDGQEPDSTKIYPTETPGLYRFMTGRGWRMAADTETYARFERENREKLEALFGEPVKGFVWPFCRQNNRELIAYLQSRGYQSLRNSGVVGDSEGFRMPADRMNWNMQASQTNLLPMLDAYEALPDDGTMKFFCVGVHSIDYEVAGKWEDVKTFARRVGHRTDLYRATVGEIFSYEDAVKSAEVTEHSIKNPSELTLFAVVNGENVTVGPGQTLEF